jgi:hypothetical protein
MQLREHVLIGGAAALALAPALQTDSIFFWAGSILIDADHYFNFLWYNRFRDFNVSRFFSYSRHLSAQVHRPEFIDLSLLHTAEFFLVAYLIVQWAHVPALTAFVVGMLFHVGLDLFSLMSQRIPTKRAHSIIEYLVRRWRLVKLGYKPEQLGIEAANVVCGKFLSPRERGVRGEGDSMIVNLDNEL